MSKRKKEKTIIKSLRITEEQQAIITQSMARGHYTSFSRFMLDSAIKTRRIHCVESKNNGIICNQIHALSVQIIKIGTNFNQVVKNYNMALKYRTSDGLPVINTGRTEFYFKKLTSQMGGIVTCMKQILNLIEEYQKTQSE